MIKPALAIAGFVYGKTAVYRLGKASGNVYSAGRVARASPGPSDSAPAAELGDAESILEISMLLDALESFYFFLWRLTSLCRLPAVPKPELVPFAPARLLDPSPHPPSQPKREQPLQVVLHF